MTRINIKYQILNLILLLLVQLPLVYRIVLFDKAFAFFYVGFLLLLPRSLSRSTTMFIGFVTGLLIDTFTNTPGIHASACVFIMFIRNFWLNTVYDDAQEVVNIDLATLKKSGFLYYMFPLVFIHHFLIFFIENGGFRLFGMLLSRVFFSAIFSTMIIFVVNFLITPNRRRV